MLHQYVMQRLLKNNESGNKPGFRTQSLNNYDIELHSKEHKYTRNIKFAIILLCTSYTY